MLRPCSRCGAEGLWSKAKYGCALICLSVVALGAQAQPNRTLTDLADDVVAANHILYHQGILDGFGHVSVRHPTRSDHFLMSQAKAPGRVTNADILEFDADANPVGAAPNVPTYSERFIHSEMYKKRRDVNAVVHSHAPSVIPFSVTRVQLIPLLHDASFLYKGAPAFDIRETFGATDLLIKDGAKGRAVAEALGESSVVLLRGHGDVVVGPDIKLAVFRAIYTAENATLQMQAMMLGGPITPISPEEGALRDLRDANVNRPGSEHGQDRTWNMWKQAADKDK